MSGRRRNASGWGGGHAGWMMALAMALAVLTGCISHAPLKPAETPKPPAARADQGMAPLGEGRDGFVIREAPRMDAAARADFDRAAALLSNGENAQAIELLEKIAAGSPGVTAPYIDLAIAYEAIGKPEKAEAHLKTALELVPGHPVACNLYGLLCRKAGRFDEARSLYEQAIARFPDYYPAHRNLGILCDLYLNDQACALEHYEIYSAGRPADEKVKLWIADLRNRMGKK